MATQFANFFSHVCFSDSRKSIGEIGDRQHDVMNSGSESKGLRDATER